MGKRGKRFVRQELPRFLKRLWEARNEAEHEGRCDPGIMRALRREALGIGCEGILPRLARIKRHLVPSASKGRRFRSYEGGLLPGPES